MAEQVSERLIGDRDDNSQANWHELPRTKITVLKSASGKPATKRFTPSGVEVYARDRDWVWREIPIATFTELARLLEKVEQDPLSLIVQGVVAPAWRNKEIIPRTKKKGKPSLIDEGSRFVHFDIDDLTLPEGTGWQDPEGVARAVWDTVITARVPALKGVSFWWQASSSAGTPGKDHLAKLHFWVLIDQPLDEVQRKALLKLAGTDESLASINQPNYVARPIFDGVPDPLAGVQRSGVVFGVKEHAAINEIDLPKEDTKPTKQRKATGKTPMIVKPDSLDHPTTDEGRTLLDRACDQIRNLPPGGRNNKINKIAFTIGGHVAGGSIAFTEAQNVLLSAGAASGHDRYAEAVTNGLLDGLHYPLTATESLQLPQAAVLTSGRLPDLVAALEDATGADVPPIAVAVLHRMEWSVPVVYSQADVLALIERCAGDKLSQTEKDALRERLMWLQKKRRKTVVSRTALDRRVLKAHNRIEVSSLDEIDITKLRGVVLVKSPMGSGKTQKIGRPFIDEAKRSGGTVMAIAHRISLISELAARLGLPNYQIVTEGEIEDAGGVAVCLPSTARNDIRDAMPSAEYVFIDEIAQVLRFLADSETCGAGEADNKAVYHRLMQIVRDAVAVVVADADLDMRTLRFLEKARPGERFTVVEMKAKPNGKTATVYHKMAATYDDITIELMNGGKVWCACESKFRAEEMARQFAQRGFKTIAITARTKNDPEVMAFLQNAEEQSRLYDLVVASPAISSGLSIEHKGVPHFTLGAFIGAGTAIRPEDAQQMLSRVRYLTRYSIAIERTNAKGGQTADAHRQGAESAAALEGLEIEWTGFDQYMAQIKAEDANAKADFGAGMWFGLEEAGWTVERGVSEGHEAAAKELKAARAEYTEARIAALIAAEPMTKDLADAAQKMSDRPLETDIRLEAHNIRISLGKPDPTAEDIVFWANGRGAETIARFEDLVGADVDVPAEHGALMQRKYRTARRKLFFTLFDGFHLDQVFTRADQETLLDRIMVQPEVFATVGIVGSKFRARYRQKDGSLVPIRRPEHPARELRDLLERCGLRTVRKRCRSVPKHDSLVNKNDGLGTKSDREYTVTVVPESLQYMHGILARREDFDIDQVIAERERSLVNVHQPPAHSEDVIVSTVLTVFGASSEKQVSDATQSAFGAVRDIREKSTVKNALGFRSGAVGPHGPRNKLQVAATPHPPIDTAGPQNALLESNTGDEDLRMQQWCAATAEIVRDVFERSRNLSPYDPDAWA